jgi:hypothetical protein
MKNLIIYTLVLIFFVSPFSKSDLIFLENAGDNASLKEETKLVRTALNFVALSAEKQGAVCNVNDDLLESNNLNVHCLFQTQQDMKEAISEVKKRSGELHIIEIRSKIREREFFDQNENKNLLTISVFSQEISGYKLFFKFEICTHFIASALVDQISEIIQIVNDRGVFSDDNLNFIINNVPKSGIFTFTPEVSELNEAAREFLLLNLYKNNDKLEFVSVKDIGNGKKCTKKAKKFMNKERSFELNEFRDSYEAEVIRREQLKELKKYR